MDDPYGMTFVGFRSELITRLFKFRVENIKRLVLITTAHPDALKTVKQVVAFLSMIGVVAEIINVQDVFDFFEIYFLCERILVSQGKPRWINISAGPGSGISALTLVASAYDIPMISYNMEKDRIIVTDTKKLIKLKKYRAKYIKVLKYLKRGPSSLSDLSKDFDVSKSAMCRRLQNLRSANVVKTTGVGRGKNRMMYSLAPLGENIINSTMSIDSENSNSE